MIDFTFHGVSVCGACDKNMNPARNCLHDYYD